MAALKHVQILVTPQVHKRVCAMASEHGLSLAAMVRNLLDEALRERDRRG